MIQWRDKQLKQLHVKWEISIQDQMHGAQSTLCLTPYRRVSKAYKYFRMRCAHGRNSPIRHLLSGFSEGDRCRCMKEDLISKIVFSIFLLLWRSLSVRNSHVIIHRALRKLSKLILWDIWWLIQKRGWQERGWGRIYIFRQRKKDTQTAQKVAYKVVESEVWFRVYTHRKKRFSWVQYRTLMFLTSVL